MVVVEECKDPSGKDRPPERGTEMGQSARAGAEVAPTAFKQP